MIVTGITETELRDVVAKLNAEEYNGNIVIESLSALSSTGTRLNVKLGTLNSKAHGSRVSWSGRHGRWLCWHGFRDVFRALMAVNPDARIKTGKAVYKGSEGFERDYPSTAEMNIGSMVQPAYMPDMCVGTCAGDWE